MGCDIHCFVEKRSKTGKWEKITGFVSDFYDPESDYFNKEEYKNADSPLDERSYVEFSILAGVRNRWDIVPISEPKGVPSDVCSDIKREIDNWDPDGHSHSYLTAKEISDYVSDDRQYAKWLFGSCLNQLMDRSETGVGDDVRIVFWFDN